MEESKKEYIFRLKDKTSNFTIIYNNCLQDNTISWQAKGLFSYLMTLPNDWEIHKTELVSHSSNGRDATLKAFDELIEKGYITVDEIKGEGGKFSKKIYRVFEESQGEVKIEHKKRKVKSTVTEKPLTENQERKTSNGNPLTENQELLNTNKQKTNTNNLYSSSKTSENEPPRFSDFSNEEKKSTRSKKNNTSYPESDYADCMALYYQNRETLSKTQEVCLTIYTAKNYRAIIKPLFEVYGVEQTKIGIKNSIHHSWIKTTDYSLRVACSLKMFDDYIADSRGTSSFKSDYQQKRQSDLERGNLNTGNWNGYTIF